MHSWVMTDFIHTVAGYGVLAYAISSISKQVDLDLMVARVLMCIHWCGGLGGGNGMHVSRMGLAAARPRVRECGGEEHGGLWQRRYECF